MLPASKKSSNLRLDLLVVSQDDFLVRYLIRFDPFSHDRVGDADHLGRQ